MTPLHIEDADDPRLGEYRDLQDGGRLRAGGFVVESRHGVRRLLTAARFPVRSVWGTPEALAALEPELAATSLELDVFVSPRTVLSAVAGFHIHQGCLAIAERGPELDARAIARDARLLLALENLADPDNVGSVFRNAQAFGAAGVWLSGGGADPLYRKAIRVSAGATLAVPFARASWPGDLEWLRGQGFTLLAGVANGDSTEIEDHVRLGARPERVCLLLGNEEHGLSAAALAEADDCVTIRTAAGFDSLNVATASGILLQRISAR